nr:hypothetical protein [Tanacetum cinerariifolium]
TRGQFDDLGNGGIDGQGGQVGVQGTEVNDGVDGVSSFSTIIAQKLQNLLPNILAQVGDQGSNMGNGRNQNGDAINDNIRGDRNCACVMRCKSWKLSCEIMPWSGMAMLRILTDSMSWLGHLAKDCRVVPRNVNSVNAKNPAAACGACFEGQGHGNNGNQAHRRAFMLGAEEARQNLNIMTGDQGSNMGNGRNQNGDAINDNIRGDVRNFIENNDRRGCIYKEFLAFNPKEYDCKEGAVV